MKIQIKARFTDAVLFECEISDDVPEHFHTREALQKAVSARANLAGADLAGANLAGANLAGADLAGADLAGADLARANLAGADLAGADLARANLAGANFTIKPATKDEAIANLDKVRAIVLENRARLAMNHWHGDDEWMNRTCAEETLCGTTHCLAGWLQVCSTDDAIRKLPNPHLAGMLAAPVATKMFFESDRRALDWLEKREYAA